MLSDNIFYCVCHDVVVILQRILTQQSYEKITYYCSVGKQHNQLLVAMIESNFDSTNLTYTQVVQAFINKYEQLFTPVPRNIITLLRGSGLDRRVPMTINVQQANTQFRNATLTMSIPTMRNYTDDYLNVVNAAQIDGYDKFQMCVYAGVAYYSGALWIVQ